MMMKAAVARAFGARVVVEPVRGIPAAAAIAGHIADVRDFM